MRSGYSDVSWFIRVVRVVLVIAGAALLGGMIGGFAMFTIDSALTWDSAPQSRPDTRTDTAASAVNPQPNKSVRIVGGAIPDPSAGMSAPPPAQQPQPQPQSSSAPAQSQTQFSPQLLTAKPFGPASHLQPQTAPAATASTAAPPQPQNQTINQPQVQTSVQAPVQRPIQTQKVPVVQQQTRWPDALSRAHQNAATGANPPGAQQPTATAPAAAQSSEGAANKNKEADRKDTERAANADDQDRAKASRHDRRRRHTAVGSNGSGTGDDAAAAASSSRRQDARSYDRLYDSYGNRRDRDTQESYGNSRQSYGNGRGQSYRDYYKDDQNDAAARSDQSRSDTRQYGRDTRSRGSSRVIVREQPAQSDRSHAFESRPRPEPFWGGGFFRRGYQDDD